MRSHGAASLDLHAPLTRAARAAPIAAALPIERRSSPGLAEFRHRYLVPRQPVILTDAAAGWPLYGRATPEHFRRLYGHRQVRVLGQPMRLAELLDVLHASTEERPGPYPCKYEIANEFPDLLAEVSPRLACSMPDRQDNALLPQRLFDGVNNLEIFFGGPGGRFPYLHFDVLHLHAWITQLHGDKEFTLYAPDQAEFLYVNPDIPWQSAMRGHHNPDLTRYPLFAAARAQKVVLHAGETLFLPCGWWHTARSLGMTISIAFDQLGADNWSDFVADIAAQRRRERHFAGGLLLAAYLRLLGPLLGVYEAFGGNRNPTWGVR
jgi:hypothetical protein